ncbi:DUF397 domain-containing protein [Sphaerisporangium sp. B11E5]|uniref:DUF397 domain-containing protein n=1 Tax=Sphaerisporangium sp. B11E5 TaxID=3153563 RepID=UPI00325F7A00
MDRHDLMAADLSGASWRKSSRSGNNGAQCVEFAADLPGLVAVRDSKNVDGPVVCATPGAWRLFLGAIKSTELG